MKSFAKKILNADKTQKRGAYLVGAAVFSNFFNLLYNAYLGRSISIENFALISLFGSILSLSDIPIGALGKTVTYKSAYLFGKYKQPATRFWKYLRGRSILLAVVITVAWLAIASQIANFFNIGSVLPILAFTPIWFFTIVASVDGGYLTGNLEFNYLATIAVIESVVKFVASFVLVILGFEKYVYAAVVFSTFVSFSLITIAAQRVKVVPEKAKTKAKEKFPAGFYLSSALTRISTVVYLSIDVVLAKHFLSQEQAGLYALLSLSGKMVFFAGYLFAQFILPIVSHKEGAGGSSRKVFYQLLAASFVSSFAAYVLFGALGFITMPLVFGSKALPIVPLISGYALSMVAFTIATNIVAFQQIKGKHLLPIVSFLLALVQILGINLYHNSMAAIANVMIVMGFVNLVVLGLLYMFESTYETVAINLYDFFEAFLPWKNQKNTRGLRILIFNWRDTKHMWAGGAEVYVHELAKQWVKEGNSVTLFCGNDRKSARNQTVDGVKVIRRGGFYTVYIWAALYYIFKFRKNFDVVVDSENGIPFFTPLFSTKPVLLLIHHVHQDVFISQMKFPLSYIGRFIEGKIMPFVYRNRTVITVSSSTKEEIVKNGIANEANIQIINPGIDLPSRKYKKTTYPSVVYVGRLKAYKNIDVAIHAFKKILKRLKNAEFWIVGEGDMGDILRDIVVEQSLTKKVKFFGKVTNSKKIELMSKAWVAVQPSQVEGWGITVIEANACKTPVVASDTNGLRDSIIDTRTGLLARVGDVNEFAAALNKILTNKSFRNTTSKNAFEWAKQFNWKNSANSFYLTAYEEVEARKSRFSFAKATTAFSRIISLF
ncbi:MAG TPA: glycosyltransferase [Patescibacteria group bacterium]|nr:glycosyltransferase [Patescibacteria group bacterium]